VTVTTTPPQHAVPAPRDLVRHAAAATLTTAVAGIVAVGFAGSYGPLRDAFLAIHQGPAAAARDPWAVDGLIAVAVASAIWLRHETAARRYALTVAAVTTAASLLLNFLHGEGVIGPGGTTTRPLHPALVFTIASLPVAAVGFGSHLLVACLRHLGAPAPDREENENEQDGNTKGGLAPSMTARTTTVPFRPTSRTGPPAQDRAPITPVTPLRSPSSPPSRTARTRGRPSRTASRTDSVG